MIVYQKIQKLKTCQKYIQNKSVKYFLYMCEGESMEEIILVTGNLGKWKIASNIFKKYNIKLLQEKIETPEIQS